MFKFSRGARFLFVSTFALLALTLARTSYGGNESSAGGGDDIGLEFQSLISRALSVTKTLDPKLFSELSQFNLEQVYSPSGARALVIDEIQSLAIDGKSQDCVAVSDPDTRSTTITRSRWQQIKSTHLKQAIALHEALVLLKIEQTGRYPYSGRFLGLFNLASESLISGTLDLKTPKETLAIHCTPTRYWRVNAAASVAKLYLVFNGKNGISDPTLILAYRIDQGIPGGNDAQRAHLDSEDSGKIVFLGGESLNGSRLSWMTIEKLTLNFNKLSVGTKGSALAREFDWDSIPGMESPDLTHKLNCVVTNKLPKK